MDAEWTRRCGVSPPLSAMLTIGKLGATRGQLDYYEAQVAAGTEDYYAGRGESPGQWRGNGARKLGLTVGARVERKQFMDLMRGRSPVDGTELRPMGKRSTVAGLDLTFSAPKTVSVLFAVADEETSRALLSAHESAVDAALAYLEREACFTRRGRDGAERVHGEGFIAASYRHRMSRAGDPQLHTHVVVGNLTLAEGRYTALDARPLYEHKSAGGAVYRAVLRAAVRERLPWVAWRQTGRGLFEIDGVEDSVLRHFSQRRVEIEERAAELVGVGAGELSRERMEGIALATRRAKQYGINGATWREEARARASEHGLGSQELAALERRRWRKGTGSALGPVTQRLSGPLGLTEMHNTFARRHALAEVAGEFVDGASIETLESATTAYLADGSVHQLTSDGAKEDRYTTVALLACERQIVEGVARRANEGTGILAPELVQRVLGSHSPALNEDQGAALRRITASGQGIDALTALAGSGKTTLMGALAHCYREAGWHAIGAAPTGRAARQLRDTAGIEAETMHTLLLRLAGGHGLSPKTLLVLDEAGMAPTRLTARLFGEAERAGVKVVAVGDPGQLGSIQAGGWLAAVTKSSNDTALRQAIRQEAPAEREALEALREGDPDTYLAHKQAEITVHDRELAGLAELVKQWTAARSHYETSGAVMIARENYTRELANRAARAQLQAAGLLASTGVFVGGREYAPGDRVIGRRNDRGHDIDNGTLATVVEIHPATGAMLIRTDAGELSTLDPSYVADHLQHAYALTAHGAQAGTFQWVGVIGRPEEFTREWAYTALSRARRQTVIHLVTEPSERDREREEYAPPAPGRDLADARDALARAMRTRELESLAIEQHTKRASDAANSPDPVRPPVPRRLSGIDQLRRREQQRVRAPTPRL
jgi:conjugative relaxase-like TrwC/TraI family protein